MTTIADVQRALIARGYDLGKTGPSGKGDDGVGGKLTSMVLAAFQRSKDLPIVDGLINPATLAALGLAAAVPDIPGFPAGIIAAAQASEAAQHIPASVSLAQWAVESGYGRSMPTGSNNPFGIKAAGGQPFVVAHTREETASGQSYYINARFRKFASLAEAFVAHAALLATSPYYATARAHLPKGTPPLPVQTEAFVREVAKHYATAHNYADVIIGLMRSRNLYQFDRVAPAGPVSTSPPAKLVVSKPGLLHRVVHGFRRR